MDFKRVDSVIIYVILLCALAAGSSEGSKRTLKFLGDGVDPATPETDEVMVGVFSF